MTRSRAGILAGAAECILQFGSRKTTMGDIARVGGVAKATLYNHFRDKDELYAALVSAEVDDLIGSCRAAYDASDGDALAAALAAAAAGVSNHPVLLRLAVSEPAVLGTLTHFGDNAAWRAARICAAGLVGDPAPSAAGDMLVRWVVSHAGWPASPAEAQLAAGPLARAARELVSSTHVGMQPGADFLVDSVRET